MFDERVRVPDRLRHCGKTCVRCRDDFEGYGFLDGLHGILGCEFHLVGFCCCHWSAGNHITVEAETFGKILSFPRYRLAACSGEFSAVGSSLRRIREAGCRDLGLRAFDFELDGF